MIKRDDLIHFITKTIGTDLLEKAELKDELANGVQFLGAKEVQSVTFGVSLSEEFLEKAVTDRSNFCIFHHGFDPQTYKSRYSEFSQRRLRLIFQNNITVMGFHYALDAHPVLGNNAQIIKQLGAKLGEPLFDEWGFTGYFEKPVPVQELEKRCTELFNRDIFTVTNEQKVMRTISVVSGAGKPYAKEFEEFKKKGVELYISGETSESIIYKMKEERITFFLCGHYTTEVFGVKALAEAIKKEFKDAVSVEFIDIPNPI